MKDHSSIVTARLEPHLKKAFDAICEENDITASQMIRGFIRQVVAEHAEKNQQTTLPTIKPHGGKRK